MEIIISFDYQIYIISVTAFLYSITSKKIFFPLLLSLFLKKKNTISYQKKTTTAYSGSKYVN